MVLITPKNKNRQAIANFEDLLNRDIQRIAIGEPRTVPAGTYAAELLENLDLYKPLESKLIFGNNVRQVLTFVESGNVDAGIVYMSDAKSSKDVAIVQIAAENLHSPIVYPVAVVQGSKKIADAENYIQFLFSPSAKLVFEKYNFILAN